ncbi:MAG: D-2-hydroxyacid dehydrogenase, partial [Eubacteriales bacterium]|nr:D-2-hydroxyacid dehydrogenase [Eubacteriales bacterium]
MEIVILDGYTINPGDLSWNRLEKMVDKFTVFDKTPTDRIASRVGLCDILMTSKCNITREIMEQAPNLKYIGSTATGYNNIDVEAAADLGIAVTNIPSYATDAVAQHTIALMLEMTNNVGLHNVSVQVGEWARSSYICYWKKPIS